MEVEVARCSDPGPAISLHAGSGLMRVNPDVLYCDTVLAPVPNLGQLPAEVYQREQVKSLLSHQARSIHLPGNLTAGEAAPALQPAPVPPAPLPAPLLPAPLPPTPVPEAVVPVQQASLPPTQLALGTLGAPLLPGMGTAPAGCVGIAVV